MKKLTTAPLFVLGLTVLSALLLPSLPAQARILDFDVSFEDPLGFELDPKEDYGWGFTASDYMLSINMSQTAENLGSYKTNIDVAMYGTSMLTVSKTVTNDTDAAWAGYKFTVKGDNVFLTGNAYALSDFFRDYNPEFDGDTITFSWDDTLPPGEMATFMFEIRLANPEPSTLVLFGLGALMLKRPRRNNS